MRRTLIEDEWKRFVSRCQLEDAPRIQQTEMRRAFYGGAGALLLTMMQNVSDSDDMQPQDEDLMRDVAGELDSFQRDVAAGRA